MIESIVDLPQPLVPITVTNSFSAISKSTPSSATTSPDAAVVEDLAQAARR